jgi:AmmeMemoRadiSam system protein B
MSNRETSVAGTFYPNSCSEIERYIDHFDNVLKENNISFETDKTIKAIISPHAGYIYSGFTANIAYQSVSKNHTPKRIVIIGPSHRVYINGASIAMYDTYKTPCGDLKIDKEYSNILKDKFGFLNFHPQAHAEHSTETQAPFVQHYFKDVDIVEIVYGKVDFNDISKITDEVLKDEDNLIVISTDLSHFYKQSDAKKLDNICLSAIEHLNLESFDKGCEACGIIGVKAMVKSALNCGLESKVLDYRTSADASGETSRVVGYTSALFF